MIDFIKPITTLKRHVDWSEMVYLLTGSLDLILILGCMTSNRLVLELVHSIKPKAVLLWKLKIALCSELVKSRVPSLWFVWKIWDFLVTWEQKFGAKSHRALLLKPPSNGLELYKPPSGGGGGRGVNRGFMLSSYRAILLKRLLPSTSQKTVEDHLVSLTWRSSL